MSAGPASAENGSVLYGSVLDTDATVGDEGNPVAEGDGDEMSYLDSWKEAFKDMVGDDQADCLPSDELERRAATESHVVENDVSTLVTPSADGSALPVLAGVLEKCSPWWLQGWRKRHYILRDKTFAFYEVADRPLGVFNFALIEFQVACDWNKAESAQKPDRTCDGSGNSVGTFWLRAIEYPDKVFLFRAPLTEAIPLVEAMRAHLLAAERDRKNADQFTLHRNVISRNNFWRYGFVHERKWLSETDTGDILLFRGRDRSASILRSVTRASYDHVALLLKTAQGEVLILEATGKSGVQAVSWTSFKAWHWHKCYQHLAVRRVYFDRQADLLKSFREWVMSVLGKRYSLTVKKLMKTRSREYDSTGASVGGKVSYACCVAREDKKAADEEPTFFCSELVAQALKHLGVLKGDRASASYWPGSFSDLCRQSLPLADGIMIGEERVIIIDDKYQPPIEARGAAPARSNH
jgi:hypothetical protein